jgi:hypothetical protein
LLTSFAMPVGEPLKTLITFAKSVGKAMTSFAMPVGEPLASFAKSV